MKKNYANSQRALPRHLADALLICIAGIALCVSVCALDRDRSVTQFHHTAWTAKDGAPSQISAFAQTEDGYLWIGSALGLFRFDGVAFEQFNPPDGVQLPSYNIYALMATPDGGLWISFRPSGLGFLKNGELKLFTL
jgi:ligand-binding sensor domain-containing protein